MGCLEYEQTKKCTREEDQGYEDCGRYESRCCGWWPCSWACKIISKICVALVWVENIVCVAWEWVSTGVCLVWDVLVIIIGAALTVIESTIGWAVSAVTFVIEVILLLPYVGPALKTILGAATAIIWIVASTPDTILGLLGIRPEKKMRVCTIILADERGQPVADIAFARRLLEVASIAFKREANVRLLPVAPLQFSPASGKVEDDWVVIDRRENPKDMVEPKTHGAGFLQSLGPIGSRFQAKAITCCTFGSWRRLTGYGAPVTAFIVRSLPVETAGHAIFETGWVLIASQGPLTNWPGPGLFNLRVLGHEALHTAGHHWHLVTGSKPSNLMEKPFRETRPDGDHPFLQTHLNNFQVLLLRASKHVTYF